MRRIRWLTTREAAARLRRSTQWVDRLAARDLLPWRQEGGRTATRYFRACCVRAWGDREACGVCSGEQEAHADDCEAEAA